MSVEGNKSVDEAAKTAAETRGIRRCLEEFTSLVYIGRRVTERKLKETKHWFPNRHESCGHIQRAQYNPGLETQEPDVAAMRRQTYISHWYFQLMSGHAAIGTFLKCIGK